MPVASNGWKMIYITIVLIVYLTNVGFGFPSRPLNERPPDFTWQAWLLVDENQNQHRHSVFNSDGSLRRRITPKSVFIAPTFSPESLPACADGYSSDSMGRCIKIIKLDEEAHYDFIIENLKDKFGSFDYEDEEKNDEIVETSQGPLQLNIPLNVDKDQPRDDYSEEETDIAIVVSPTKPIIDIEHLNFKKRDSLLDEAKQEMFIKGLKTNTSHPITTVSPLQLETTTNSIENETYSTTLDNDVTTTFKDDINIAGVNIRNSGENSTATEHDYETTTVSASNYIDTTTEDYLTTTSLTDSVSVSTPITDQDVNDYKVATQSPKPIDLQNDTPFELTSEKSRFEPSTASPKPESMTKNTVRFPDQEKSNFQLDNSFVRFPDQEISYNTQSPPSIGTRELQEIAEPNSYKHKPADTPVAFPDSISSAYHSNTEYNKPQNVPNKAVRWEFNRRNRDKNVFMLPPKWNPSTFQKPLVLRFSRKHAFMDNNEFKSPAYYRSIPPDDFAYLFKFKQKRIRR